MVTSLGSASPSCVLHQNQREEYIDVKIFTYENNLPILKIYRISEDLFKSLVNIGDRGWHILDGLVRINGMNFNVQSFEVKFLQYVEEKKIQPILTELRN